jgi:hypothetical protein
LAGLIALLLRAERVDRRDEGRELDAVDALDVQRLCEAAYSGLRGAGQLKGSSSSTTEAN